MDNFLNLILETLGLADDSLDEARSFHARVIATLIILVGILVLIGYCFHRIGFGSINIIIGLLLDFAALIAFLRPEPLLIFLGLGTFLGIMKTPETISQETRDVFSWYANACGNFLLISSIIFMFLGTWPWVIGFGNFLVICLSLLTLVLMSTLWKKSGRFGKTFAYAYTILILVVFVFWTSAPDAAKAKIFGPDFPREFVSEEEIVLEEINGEKRELEKRKTVEQLEKIKHKVQDGQKLSREEEIFLKKAQEKQDKETIPAKISSLIPKSGESKNEAPLHSEKEIIISQNSRVGTLEIENLGKIKVWTEFRGDELFMKSIERSVFFSANREKSGCFYGNWKEEGREGGLFHLQGDPEGKEMKGGIRTSKGYVSLKLIF